jgi:hypothetical protein
VVIHAGTQRAVFLYRARPDAVRRGLRPYDWYHALVVSGARHHGLPEAYVERLAAVAANPDPDAGRAAKEHALLTAGAGEA